MSTTDQFKDIVTHIFVQLSILLREVIGFVIDRLHVGRESPEFKVRILPGAKLPTRGSSGSAGYDLYAYIGESDTITLQPGDHQCIPSGVCVQMHPGIYAHVAARSGLALRNGIITMAGIIDSDYKDSIGVILFNKGPEPFTVTRGMRIAQLIFHHHIVPKFTQVDKLDESERGTGGFGSTGLY